MKGWPRGFKIKIVSRLNNSVNIEKLLNTLSANGIILNYVPKKLLRKQYMENDMRVQTVPILPDTKSVGRNLT